MTDPDAWTDRWFRRYESDVPVEVWRGTLRYASVRASAAWRPGKRELLKAFEPIFRTMGDVFSAVQRRGQGLR